MLGVRLDKDTERDLDALARRTRQPKSQIAREAIRAYVSRHDRTAQARAEWAKISTCERDNRDIEDILDFAAREMDSQL